MLDKMTVEQKQLLLYLGGTEEDDRFLIAETLEELIALGLLYRSENSHVDLTEEGERIHDILEKAKYPGRY